MGLQEHLKWCGATCSDTRALKVPLSAKMTKMPLVNLGLTEGQNPHKITLFIVLHQTRASRIFWQLWSSLTQSWLLVGHRNPNFDSAVKMGWNKCHCKDDQIIILTTIHGSKSELEWPRYHENRVNALIDALLASRSHNFWSDHWIFQFHTFLETESQELPRGFKINPIQDHLKVAALQGLPSRKACRGYKKAPSTSRPKKEETLLVLCTTWTNFKLLSSPPNVKIT